MVATIATGIALTGACAVTHPVPPLAAGVPAIGVVRSKTGILVAELATFNGGTWVRTPCYGVTVLRESTPVPPPDVVLDPGHGGNEDGATGPNGLQEKELNLAVATRVKTLLEQKGHTVVMTRDGDLREPIRTRGDLAEALKPKVFVSIHHNASGPPPRKGRPGTEVYHQATSEASRQLAQDLWDRETTALSTFDIPWSADDNNPGPKFRIGDNGDYYGVLRDAAGIPSVISEAAFITSPAEADLMTTDTFRDTEAEAIASAIDHYLSMPAPTGTIAVGPPPRRCPAPPPTARRPRRPLSGCPPGRSTTTTAPIHPLSDPTPGRPPDLTAFVPTPTGRFAARRSTFRSDRVRPHPTGRIAARRGEQLRVRTVRRRRRSGGPRRCSMSCEGLLDARRGRSSWTRSGRDRSGPAGRGR